MILRAIRDYLETKPELLDVLTDEDTFQVFADVAPAGAPLPYVVLTLISSEPLNNIANESACAQDIVQIDVYGRTALDAFELTELIRLAPMSCYRGPMGSTTVESCTLVRKTSVPEYVAAGRDEHIRRISADYKLVYKQEQPF